MERDANHEVGHTGEIIDFDSLKAPINTAWHPFRSVGGFGRKTKNTSIVLDDQIQIPRWSFTFGRFSGLLHCLWR